MSGSIGLFLLVVLAVCSALIVGILFYEKFR